MDCELSPVFFERARFGDPDYIPNLPDYQDFIVQPEYAENIRQKITDNQTHPIEYYNPEGLEIKNTYELASHEQINWNTAANHGFFLGVGRLISPPQTRVVYQSP